MLIQSLNANNVAFAHDHAHHPIHRLPQPEAHALMPLQNLTVSLWLQRVPAISAGLLPRAF